MAVKDLRAVERGFVENLKQRLRLRRIDAGYTRRVQDELAATVAEMEARVAAGRAVFSSSLRRDIARASAGYVERLGDIQAEIEKVVPGIAYDGLDALGSTFAAGRFSGAFRRPSEDLLAAALTAQPFQGRLLAEHSMKLGHELTAQVSARIAAGVVSGQTTDEIARSLGAATGLSRTYAETWAITAVQSVHSSARAVMLKANADLIEGVMAVVTLDERTCRICGPRDGLVWRYEKSGRYVPDGHSVPYGEGPGTWHMRCRCAWIPVIDAEEAKEFLDLRGGTRASRGGPVGVSKDYEDWLRDEPRSVRRAVLGRARAEWWEGRPDVSLFDAWRSRFGNLPIEPEIIAPLPRRTGGGSAPPPPPPTPRPTRPPPPPPPVKPPVPKAAKPKPEPVPTASPPPGLAPTARSIVDDLDAASRDWIETERKVVWLRAEHKRKADAWSESLKAGRGGTQQHIQLRREMDSLRYELDAFERGQAERRAGFRSLLDRRLKEAKAAAGKDPNVAKALKIRKFEAKNPRRSPPLEQVESVRRKTDEAAAWIRDRWSSPLRAPRDEPHRFRFHKGGNKHSFSVEVYHGNTGHRANYLYRDGAVGVSDDVGVDVIVHELGHHLESRLEDWQWDRMREFMARRFGDEGFSLLPGRMGANGETAIADKFVDHYVGKVYGVIRDGRFQRQVGGLGRQWKGEVAEWTDSTEFLSMGLQMMYNDPVSLYALDRDFFEFILDLMTRRVPG